MSEWNTEPLGNVISFMAKGITPKYATDRNEHTILVLNQKCNRNFAISIHEARYHDLAQKSVPQDKILRKDDILINSTGTGTAGRIAQIEKTSQPTTVDGHMIIVRANEKIDPLYLGYALKGQQPNIEAMAEGSTGQTEINRNRLCNEIFIQYPSDMNEQKKIANTLQRIDKKVGVNQQINDNLYPYERKFRQVTRRNVIPMKLPVAGYKRDAA